MDKENINIEITVDGVTRKFRADYDTLYNKDWDEEVRDMIEAVEEIDSVVL